MGFLSTTRWTFFWIFCLSQGFARTFWFVLNVLRHREGAFSSSPASAVWTTDCIVSSARHPGVNVGTKHVAVTWFKPYLSTFFQIYGCLTDPSSCASDKACGSGSSSFPSGADWRFREPSLRTPCAPNGRSTRSQLGRCLGPAQYHPRLLQPMDLLSAVPPPRITLVAPTCRAEVWRGRE